MNREEVYSVLISALEKELEFLNCKPDETAESTLKVLWMTAAGKPCSVAAAMNQALPELTETQISDLKNLVRRRLGNEPLSYIAGRQNFMGVELLSTNQALIPRKETEILGYKALDISLEIVEKEQNPIVFDICCGSGNLGIALAKLNPAIDVYAGDISEEAIRLANDNIKHLNLEKRVKARQSDMFEAFRNYGFNNRIDIIVCNPPYISSGKVPKMDTEISLNEPSVAFDGGVFGFSIIQRLIRESHEFLNPVTGWLLFEVGSGQGEMIINLCKKTGLYKDIDSVKDKSGVIRVLLMKKN